MLLAVVSVRMSVDACDSARTLLLSWLRVSSARGCWDGAIKERIKKGGKRWREEGTERKEKIKSRAEEGGEVRREVGRVTAGRQGEPNRE